MMLVIHERDCGGLDPRAVAQMVEPNFTQRDLLVIIRTEDSSAKPQPQPQPPPNQMLSHMQRIAQALCPDRSLRAAIPGVSWRVDPRNAGEPIDY